MTGTTMTSTPDASSREPTFVPTQLAYHVRRNPDIAAWRQRLFGVVSNPDGEVVVLTPAEFEDLWPWVGNVWYKTGNNSKTSTPHDAAGVWLRWTEYRCYHWHGFQKKYQGTAAMHGKKARARPIAQRMGCEHAKAKVVVEFYRGLDAAGHLVEEPLLYKIHLTGFHASADGLPHDLASIDKLGQPDALRTAHKIWCEAFKFDKKTLKRFRSEDAESDDFLRTCGLLKPFDAKTIDNDCARMRSRAPPGRTSKGRGDDSTQHAKAPSQTIPRLPAPAPPPLLPRDIDASRSSHASRRHGERGTKHLRRAEPPLPRHHTVLPLRPNLAEQDLGSGGAPSRKQDGTMHMGGMKP